jgi:hypothetical protein
MMAEKWLSFNIIFPFFFFLNFSILSYFIIKESGSKTLAFSAAEFCYVFLLQSEYAPLRVYTIE